ncbi:MAG: menaquinone biosynthesis protein [Thermodesulfobacteriota bacterium]
MGTQNLIVGQINYLNIWPVFYFLKKDNGLSAQGIDFLEGHPSELNMLLRRGEVDMAPASLFEYLENAELYHLLPDNGISASREVQSVIFCTPVHGDRLKDYIRQGGEISLTSASATSVALLKILWKYAWDLPEPEWINSEPGRGTDTDLPFLEIGNFALETWLNPPTGYQVFDLAREWRKFTDLPFVFAVWIVRDGLEPAKIEKIKRLHQIIENMKPDLPQKMPSIVDKRPPGRFKSEDVIRYWRTMHYGLPPENLAAITLFGKYCHELGLIKGVPALSWQF